MNPNWSRTTLQQICIPTGLQTGPFGGQLHAGEYAESGIPVIMPRDLCNNRVSQITPSRVPVEVANRLKPHFVAEGDLVFARRGDIGRFAVVSAEQQGWLCGTGCIRARLDPSQARPRYVAVAVEFGGAILWLKRHAVGQTMPNLSTEIVAKLPLTLPTLAEQRAIEEIDDLFGRTDEILTTIIQAKQRVQHGLMQQLLSGHIRLKQVASSRWRIRRFSEFFVHFAEESGTSDRTLFSCSKLHGIVPQTEKFANRPAPKDLRRYKVVHPGDLVVDRMLLWDASLAFVERGEGVVSPDYATFHFNEREGDRSFFKALLKSHRLRHLYKTLARGSNTRRRRVLPRDFLSIKMPLPEQAEQAFLGRVFSDLAEETAMLERQRSLLESQKRAVMHKVLTGEVRLQT